MRSAKGSSGTTLRRVRRGEPGQRGQSLVEFALVLTPLLLILLGIIQFGFVFNTYVTLTNAAREAAREGTIYVYDRTLTKGQNDAARNKKMQTDRSKNPVAPQGRQTEDLRPL